MEELIYSEKEKDILRICDYLEKGKIIALPTDTIYGFSINPFNKMSVEKLWHIKKRPFSKKMILLANSIEMVQKYVSIKLTE